MVKLINVKCEGETASCNFFCPTDQDESEAGFIRVNRKKIIEYDPIKGEEEYSPGATHAADYLFETFDMESVPETKVIYWY